MAQTKEERSLAAKRHRLDVLYRITPEEEWEVENYQLNDPTLQLLLQRGNGEFDALRFTDHRHSDGLIRGRLAYLINKALGTIEVSYKERTPATLRALADYLEHPPFERMWGPRYGMIGRAKMNKKKKVYGSASGPIQPPKKVRRKK